MQSDKISKIAAHFGSIMELLGLDLTDPGQCDTPQRVAKMYVNELCIGLDKERMPKATAFPNEKFDQVILIKDITFNSLCQHHFVPFTGKADIAYLPTKGGNILGLSKFNRIVQYLAAKPHVQEALTQEIYSAFVEILLTEDIAVVLEAKHLCCGIRGVKDPESSTITSYLGGAFRSNPELRAEYFNLTR